MEACLADWLAGLWILTLRGNQIKDTCPDVTSLKSRTHYLHSEAEISHVPTRVVVPSNTLLGQRISNPKTYSHLEI